MPVIDPSFLARGADWQVGGVGGLNDVDPSQATGAPGSSGASFGSMLSDQISSLEGLQTQAAQASQSLADGTATDPSSVVMSVERARLAMQLASQLRTKGVEAINDIFHTSV
jgi:flagellar hook-basal body complex protein FliE